MIIVGKRPQPVTGKFTGVWSSGNTKGVKKYDFGGGVGLGIVVAFEKTELVSQKPNKRIFITKTELVSHKPNKRIFITRSQTRSIPMEMENNEDDYTFGTCHGPNKTNTSIKVYYDGGHNYGVKTRESIVFDTKSVKSKGCCLFDISPAKFPDDLADYPESDILSFCCLCRKNLHGKDIYMYRGEKAFCSTECRNMQIEKDERKENLEK